MPIPFNKNLNSAPLYKTRGYGTCKDRSFHFRNKIKVKGKETDVYKCSKCQRTLPVTAFSPHCTNSNGIYRLSTQCRRCVSSTVLETKKVRRKAPPAPSHCDCCHKKTKLQLDHLHGTTTFRGWLCRNCNTGMGVLGDTLEGVLQAAIYLEHDINKIIETLHKVYDEMFARTDEEK